MKENKKNYTFKADQSLIDDLKVLAKKLRVSVGHLLREGGYMMVDKHR